MPPTERVVRPSFISEEEWKEMSERAWDAVVEDERRFYNENVRPLDESELK